MKYLFKIILKKCASTHSVSIFNKDVKSNILFAFVCTFGNTKHVTALP